MLGAAFSLMLNQLDVLLCVTPGITRLDSNQLFTTTPKLPKTARTSFRQHTHIVESTMHFDSGHARLQSRIVLSEVGGSKVGASWFPNKMSDVHTQMHRRALTSISSTVTNW